MSELDAAFLAESDVSLRDSVENAEATPLYSRLSCMKTPEKFLTDVHPFNNNDDAQLENLENVYDLKAVKVSNEFSTEATKLSSWHPLSVAICSSASGSVLSENGCMWEMTTCKMDVEGAGDPSQSSASEKYQPSPFAVVPVSESYSVITPGSDYCQPADSSVGMGRTSALWTKSSSANLPMKVRLTIGTQKDVTSISKLELPIKKKVVVSDGLKCTDDANLKRVCAKSRKLLHSDMVHGKLKCHGKMEIGSTSMQVTTEAVGGTASLGNKEKRKDVKCSTHLQMSQIACTVSNDDDDGVIETVSAFTEVGHIDSVIPTSHKDVGAGGPGQVDDAIIGEDCGINIVPACDIPVSESPKTKPDYQHPEGGCSVPMVAKQNSGQCRVTVSNDIAYSVLLGPAKKLKMKGSHDRTSSRNSKDSRVKMNKKTTLQPSGLIQSKACLGKHSGFPAAVVPVADSTASAVKLVSDIIHVCPPKKKISDGVGVTGMCSKSTFPDPSLCEIGVSSKACSVRVAVTSKGGRSLDSEDIGNLNQSGVDCHAVKSPVLYDSPRTPWLEKECVWESGQWSEKVEMNRSEIGDGAFQQCHLTGAASPHVCGRTADSCFSPPAIMKSSHVLPSVVLTGASESSPVCHEPMQTPISGNCCIWDVAQCKESGIGEIRNDATGSSLPVTTTKSCSTRKDTPVANLPSDIMPQHLSSPNSILLNGQAWASPCPFVEEVPQRTTPPSRSIKVPLGSPNEAKGSICDSCDMSALCHVSPARAAVTANLPQVSISLCMSDHVLEQKTDTTCDQPLHSGDFLKLNAAASSKTQAKQARKDRRISLILQPPVIAKPINTVADNSVPVAKKPTRKRTAPLPKGQDRPANSARGTSCKITSKLNAAIHLPSRPVVNNVSARIGDNLPGQHKSVQVLTVHHCTAEKPMTLSALHTRGRLPKKSWAKFDSESHVLPSLAEVVPMPVVKHSFPDATAAAIAGAAALRAAGDILPVVEDITAICIGESDGHVNGCMEYLGVQPEGAEKIADNGFDAEVHLLSEENQHIVSDLLIAKASKCLPINGMPLGDMMLSNDATTGPAFGTDDAVASSDLISIYEDPSIGELPFTEIAQVVRPRNKRRVSRADEEVISQAASILDDSDDAVLLPEFGKRSSRRLRRTSIEIYRKSLEITEDEPFPEDADDHASHLTPSCGDIPYEPVVVMADPLTTVMEDKPDQAELTVCLEAAVEEVPSNSLDDTNIKDGRPQRQCATQAPLLPPSVVVTSRRRSRRKEASSPSIEDIYLNRLWRTQMPKERAWESIPESSIGGSVTSQKLRCMLSFDDVPNVKRLRQRRAKAVARGWKPLTKKRLAVLDRLLELKLAEAAADINVMEGPDMISITEVS